jgi:dipeptidase E
MKLLLTSAGLRNAELKQALLDLANVAASKLKVAFIPTAMNVESGDKSWVIDEMNRLRDMGIAQLDIIDITASPKNTWLPRLEESNVIFVNGGNTTYLMERVTDSGLAAEMPRLLQERLYVGASAGSYIATPDTRLSSDQTNSVLRGLGLVPFGIQAHYQNPEFAIAETEALVRKRARDCPYIVYALDDETAIKVDGESIEVIGTGQYLVLQPSGP